MAQNINALPTDAYSSDGYSLIATHAWTKSVDSIIACAALLDSNVIVVTPDEFVKRIQNKMGSTLGLSNVENKELISIYPNPTKNELIIKNEQVEINQVKIINSTGQVIRTFQGYSRILNVKDLPNGIYLIQFLTDGQHITKRFIKYK